MIGQLERVDVSRSVYEAVSPHLKGEKYTKGFMKPHEYEHAMRNLNAIEANLLGEAPVLDAKGKQLNLASMDKQLARRYEFVDKTDPASAEAMKLLDTIAQMIREEMGRAKEYLRASYEGP